MSAAQGLQLLLLLLVAAAAACGTASASSSVAQRGVRGDPQFPSNFTVGILHVDEIWIGEQQTATLWAFGAEAWIDLPDAEGRVLRFGVTGDIGVEPFVVAFAGKQNGTWSPFNTSDLQLSFLSIAYNSTTGAGSVSGGDTVFGSWTVEADLDFIHGTGAAIGFVVTDAKPSFNGMPGAPAHAFDALDSLLNVGLVVSSYDGAFTFTSGATVQVHAGVNVFAASVFDGVTITYHGMVHFAGGFAVSLTAEADNFHLGDGIAVSSATITVQYPAQPFLGMTVDATWVGLAFTLQGSLSTTDVQFTGNAPGPWTIKHGSTPVVVSNMLLTFDHTFSPSQTTGELRGSAQWGSWPEVTGIMKYPADPQALGCFSLTLIIGNPSTSLSLNGVVQQAVGNSNASSAFPDDSHELFGNTLESITLSVYPDCGAFYIGATLSTNTFGTVGLAFAMFEYVPVGSVLATFAQDLPSDPPVPIASGSGYTVGAKEVLQSLAIAFDTVTPPILVAKAYIENQPVYKSLQQVISTASVMRQQLLVQLTEHAVQVDAMALLQACDTVLQQSVTWDAPASYDNATWEWYASLTVTGAHWPLSEPSGLYLTDASFALASASFQMTVGDSSIMAQVGFNFLVDLDVSQSTLPALDAVKKVDTCADKSFQVSGYIGNQQTGWFLQGALTSGCIQLGSNLQLSSTSLRVQSAEPQASFSTVLTLPQTQDMQFEVSATLSYDAGSSTTTVQMSGSSQSVYHTNVGAKPLEIDNCNLQMTVSVGASSSSFAASLSGAVTIDDQTEVSASSSFDSSTTAMSFSLTVHEDHPVYMFNLLKLLIGDDAFNKIPIPESGKDKLAGVYFAEGSFSLATQPPSLSGSLQVVAFYEFLVSASISFANGQVACGFSVQRQSDLLDPIHLSDILPNITIIDEFRMRTPVIILASAPASLTIPGIEVTFNVKTGFNFAAFLALDTSTPRSTQLTKWLGNNTVLVSGVIDPAAAQFELQAQAALDDVPIVNGLDLTAAGFYIHVDTPTVEVGFDAKARLQLSSAPPTPDNTLLVTTTFVVGTNGASFSAQITGQWVSPFGVRGVTFLSGTVAAALGADFALSSFELSGTAQVGNVQGTVTFVCDGLVITESALAVELQSVSLERDILQAVCGKAPPNMFADGAMQSVTFSVNPTLHTVAGKYPPGIAVAATNFVIGSVTLSLVEFAVDPVLGVKIIVDAASSGTPNVAVGASNMLLFNSWSMEIDLMLSADMGVHVHGQVAAMGVQALADVDIDVHEFRLAFNFTSGVVSIVLAGGVQSGNDPFHVPDLTVSGALELNGYLSQRLLYYAQQTSDQKGPEIKAIEQKIADLNNDIANLNNEIAQRSANDTAAKQAAQQAVAKAQQAVDDAQAKVDQLGQQIVDAQNKLKQCAKYDLACQAKWKAEILTLQAAQATADAALDAAKQVLQAAQDALNKIPDPDVDPQIIAWKAEVVADQGLIATLQGTLDADEAVTKLASEVLQAGASALQPTNMTFSSTSFVAVSHGQNGNVEIVGQFLNKPVTLNVGMALNNVEQFVQDVWAALQKLGAGASGAGPLPALHVRGGVARIGRV